MNLSGGAQAVIVAVGFIIALHLARVLGSLADWWWLWRPQEQRYIRGDGDALLRGLRKALFAQYVPHATALGLYREAEQRMRRDARHILEASRLNDGGRLLRVNFAETLSELGHFDEALELTREPAENLLIEAGRRCVRGWILSARGNSDAALKELEGVNDSALGNYKAEYWFTLAFAQLTAGRLDEAEVALQRAKAVLVRASSERNFEFLMAQLRWKQGRRDEAHTHFETAAKHSWRWQGGAGLLAWGDALKEFGRDDDARAAWAQCLSQDPQSLAADIARKRLAAAVTFSA